MSEGGKAIGAFERLSELRERLDRAAQLRQAFPLAFGAVNQSSSPPAEGTWGAAGQLLDVAVRSAFTLDRMARAVAQAIDKRVPAEWLDFADVVPPEKRRLLAWAYGLLLAHVLAGLHDSGLTPSPDPADPALRLMLLLTNRAFNEFDARLSAQLATEGSRITGLAAYRTWRHAHAYELAHAHARLRTVKESLALLDVPESTAREAAKRLRLLTQRGSPAA